MNDASDRNWKPDPQLLAAYLDGELEARDDVAEVRARLEAWLEQHPEAVQECAKHQQLQKLWLDTTPAEPSVRTWNETLDQIDAQRRQPIAPPPSKRPWLAVGIVVASVLVLIGVLFGALRSMAPTDVKLDPVAVAPIEMPKADDEVFPVATADEVVVLYIEGRDTSAVVVGLMPVHGPLELAGPGEVQMRMRPDVNDRTVLHSGPPMVWAKLETE